MFSGLSQNGAQQNEGNAINDILAVYHPDRATEVAIKAGVLPRLLEADQAVAEQVHENDLAQVVIVCEPEGASLMMGALHPRASLYERPVNLQEAQKAHAAFRDLLRRNGCKVRMRSLPRARQSTIRQYESTSDRFGCELLCTRGLDRWLGTREPPFRQPCGLLNQPASHHAGAEAA